MSGMFVRAVYTAIIRTKRSASAGVFAVCLMMCKMHLSDDLCGGIKHLFLHARMFAGKNQGVEDEKA